jgi:hypothetical protein
MFPFPPATVAILAQSQIRCQHYSNELRQKLWPPNQKREDISNRYRLGGCLLVLAT